eukprot:1154571-Pelagomonas_calceolata.AAC.1
MKFASKFIGALVVESQLFKLIQGVLSIAGPTNTQKDGVESHDLSTNELAEVSMLPLCRLLLALAAGLHGVGGAVSRGWLLRSSVLGCACCGAHGVSEWKKEKKER